MMSFRKQLWILIGITTFFVGPYLLLHGTNIVTHTYQFGAQRIMQGLTPFVDPQGVSDWFKYSPFFGLLYYPLSLLSPRPEAFVWGVINLVFFWWGMSRWAALGKEAPKWLWASFLFASMELDGSVRYQQMNAILVGFTLLGAADFRDERYVRSALWFVLGSSFKLLPGLVLAPLFFSGTWLFAISVTLWGLLTLIVPAIVVGPTIAFNMHRDWMNLLLYDSQHSGILDLATVLGRYGWEGPNTWILIPLAVLTLLGLILTRRMGKTGLGLLVSLAFLSLLLISPRTESPTFVLAAPAYLLLALELANLPKRPRLIGFAILATGIFLITFCMNDLWPRAIWDATSMKQANKTFGALVLWLLTWSIIWKRSTAPEPVVARGAAPWQSRELGTSL